MRYYKQIILSLIVLSCAFITGNAQEELLFRHLTRNEGLLHDNVTCIVQDSLGYMWFGSHRGLNRYDGYSIDSYKYENAGRYLKKLTDAKGLNYAGCAQIIMPENYIAMFATPTQEEAAGIIRGSLRAIDEAARQIKDSRPFPQLPITRKDKINSSIVNILFYPMFVHAKKFQATSACTSCGKCAVICPLNNIRLTNGTPVWGKNCTHCMACINRCPSQAIEYGKHTQTLPRYTCPKSI